MKKFMISILVIVSLLTAGQALAATTVQPPSGVGTYVGFDHTTQLQWRPVYGAVAYRVYLASGYNAQTGYILQHTLTNPRLVYVNRIYWIYDYVSTSKIQWYSVRVTSVDKYGNESVPFQTSVNVWR